jgi:hypothetical protein
MKERARTAEKAVKTHEAELDKLRKAAMSDQEKAVAEAMEQGRKEATVSVASRLAAAEIKAALTGIVPDPAAVVEDLNLARYIDEDGEVDAKAVEALKEKYAAFAAPGGKAPVPGVPVGARSTAPTQTLAEALAEAKAAGDTRRYIALQNGQLQPPK